MPAAGDLQRIRERSKRGDLAEDDRETDAGDARRVIWRAGQERRRYIGRYLGRGQANRRGLEWQAWLVPRMPRLRRTQSDHGARRPLRALTGPGTPAVHTRPLSLCLLGTAPLAVDFRPQRVPARRSLAIFPIRVPLISPGRRMTCGLGFQVEEVTVIVEIPVPVVRRIINMTDRGRPMDAKRLPVWGGEGASAELPQGTKAIAALAGDPPDHHHRRHIFHHHDRRLGRVSGRLLNT